MSDDLRALLGDLDPGVVARVLADVPEKDLRKELRGDLRDDAVGEVFRRLPDYLNAEQTAQVRETIGFVVDGEGWTVRIEDGTCTAVREAPGDAARVTLELDAVDFLRTVTGVADTAALWLSGRLKLSGDEPWALELAALFRAPSSSGRIDPFAIDVPKIAAVIKATNDSELRERLRGGLRDIVLDQIFVRVPAYVNAERAAGVTGALKFVLTGRADGEADRYAIVFEDGKAVGGQLEVDDPRVTIRVDAADFLKLVTSNLNPVMATIRGKIKVKGDVPFAASAMGLFHIPSA